MNLNNKLYQNQGIHAIASIFTVENGITKVLLIKKNNEPYKNRRLLVGGAIYNNEDVVDGLRREIRQKTGLKDLMLEQYAIFSDPKRDPVARMLAIGYIGIISSDDKAKMNENENLEWFDVKCLPKLGYDHEIILESALNHLKKRIISSNILNIIFPRTFTMPELQRVYETLLDQTLDRRNFRKKIIRLGIVENIDDYTNNNGGRPAKLYQFKNNIKEQELF